MKKQRKRLFTLVGLLMLASSQAQAADITVGADGNCTLAEAIASANNDAADGNGCVDGFEDDTIILEIDVVLDDPEEVEDARPPIITTVTIEGQGHIINGNDRGGYVLKISGGPYDVVPCIGGDLTLNNATITGGNHAHLGDVSFGTLNNGGGITNACFGTVTLNNTTVSKNHALGNGGGIFNAPWAELIVNNSTISGNTSGGNGGGGIYNNNGYVELNNSTISDNIATGVGGGIDSVWLYGPSPSWIGSSVVLNNSIVSDNTAASGNEIYQSEVPIYADNSNLFGHSGESEVEAFSGLVPGVSDVNATADGTSGILISTASSDILNPLADNGGLTMTHALVPDSPAIDLDGTCSTGLTEDQRGEPRPVGEGCDAGSFEFANHLPVAVIANAGVTLDVKEGDLVCLDGNASSDADNDSLTYSWNLTVSPDGSAAELDNSASVAPCFTADLLGTYEVTLVVNDGTGNSLPTPNSIITAMATTLPFPGGAAIAALEETALVINSLDSAVFNKKSRPKALSNQIDATIDLVDEELYAQALGKLENSILGKTDGCVESGEPDKNDWINECTSQEEVYDLVQEAIASLEEQI